MNKKTPRQMVNALVAAAFACGEDEALIGASPARLRRHADTQTQAEKEIINAMHQLREELRRLVEYYEPGETRAEAIGKLNDAKNVLAEIPPGVG